MGILPLTLNVDVVVKHNLCFITNLLKSYYKYFLCFSVYYAVELVTFT